MDALLIVEWAIETQMSQVYMKHEFLHYFLNSRGRVEALVYYQRFDEKNRDER